jgi:hypothetical protein
MYVCMYACLYFVCGIGRLGVDGKLLLVAIREVVALRLFGAVERGSSRVYLEWMVPKLVEAGGGGPIEKEELWRILGNCGEDESERPYKVRYGSIIHTDSARAYANLAGTIIDDPKEEAMKNLPLEGPKVQQRRLAAEADAGFLLQRRESSEAARYAQQKYAVTHVVHKKKIGARRCFVKLVKVRLHNGDSQWVKAGTEVIDGHWASIRRCVARTPVNTWHLNTLDRNLRFCQWKHWHGPGVNKLKALGAALKAGRELMKDTGLTAALLQKASRTRSSLKAQRRIAGRASAFARHSRRQAELQAARVATEQQAEVAETTANSRMSSRASKASATGDVPVAAAGHRGLAKDSVRELRSAFAPPRPAKRLKARTPEELEADMTRMYGPRVGT